MEQRLTCICQLHERENRLIEIERQLENSRKRADIFWEALGEHTSPFFVAARDQIQKENGITGELKETARTLTIQSLQDFSVGTWFLLLPTIVLSLLAGRLMIVHARHADIARSEDTKLTDWHRPYWMFVLLPVVANELREIKTSVWDIDKSWFSWGSFCVCRAVEG
jgi:hypothetical protein